MKYQSKNPFPQSVHHDHGIVSALIFLRLMHEEYSRHKDGEFSRTRFGRVFWHSKILDHSILQIAIAIAMHNLESHSEALKINANNQKIFNIEIRPLAWLLKIADILQEWDKPKVEDSLKAFPNSNLKINFSRNKILISNFPKEKIDGTLSVLDKYSKPNNLICFNNI